MEIAAVSPADRLAYPVDQAAYIAGLGRSRFYEEIAAGRVASFKVGRRRLVTREALEAFVALIANGE